MGDLFEGLGAGAQGLTGAPFDEMVDGDGVACATCGAVANSLAQMGRDDVSIRGARLTRAFRTRTSRSILTEKSASYRSTRCLSALRALSGQR
jgi:hypothetical protein